MPGVIKMRKKSILIINCSQVLMEISRKILERGGFSVYCALGVAGARERLADLNPDAIVLDHDLPDGEGLELCREIREKSGVPIMFVSNSKDDELPALQAGASDFLKKPYDYAVLKMRLRILINLKYGISGERGGQKSRDQHILINGSNWPHHKTQGVNESESGAGEQAKKMKKAGLAYIYAVSACFLIAFVILGMYGLTGGFNKAEEIPEVSIPLAPFTEDESAKPYHSNSGAVKAPNDISGFIPSYDSITVHAGSTDMSMTLLNPKKNDCYFTFMIVLTDTEEIIYSSDLVAPGKFIDNFAIKRALEHGTYSAELIIRALDPDNMNEIAASTIRIEIISE